jgi:hypothetical protein
LSPHPSDPGGVVGARFATRRTRVVWKWLRWTRLPLTGAMLLVAGITVAVDVGTAWADIDMGSLGRVPISPALPLGILLACMVGLRRLGLDRPNIRAWREFLIVSGFVLLFGIWRYSMYVHGGREAIGLILAALGEELVYRLAILILVGAGGFTYVEAAEICGTRPGTMKSRVARARVALRSALDGSAPLPVRVVTDLESAYGDILAQLSTLVPTGSIGASLPA